MKRLTPFAAFAPLVLSLALTACGTYTPFAASTPQLVGQVTAYHQWPAQQGRSFVFDTPSSASLEQQTLANTLAAALAKHGFTRASNGASADVVIGFSTQLDSKNMRVVDFVRPWGWGVDAWGGVGPWYSPWYGSNYGPNFGSHSYRDSHNRHRFSAHPFFYSQFHAPLVPVERTITANQRVLKLLMATPQGQRIYEGSIISTGSTAVMNDVLPALVDGLMQRFPGDTAKSWAVQVPLMMQGK